MDRRGEEPAYRDLSTEVEVPHRINRANVIDLTTLVGLTYYPHQFMTPVPAGFDTVWGFLAKEEPHVLDLMQDPVRGLIVDQNKAQIHALLLGHDTHIVQSPAAVAARGIASVQAFTLEVLRQVFPT
jgi:hypothetical protein